MPVIRNFLTVSAANLRNVMKAAMFCVPILLTVACDSERTGSRQLVDQIEQSIKLPEGADEIQSYSRYYARHGDVVYAAYIVHSDGWREFVIEGCSLQGSDYPCNDPKFGVIEPGQFSWVEKRNHLPIRNGGGCSFVEIEYDVKQKTFVKIACNGDT
ncbi:hypothetical protein [Sphingorhabdus contaminans]|uniref:hypothetical protein n=1 Tax=Sphingorhabdus contaminans TaxID=1343899 RepID=UPI003D270C28